MLKPCPKCDGPHEPGTPCFGENTNRPACCTACPISKWTRGFAKPQPGPSTTVLVGDVLSASDADSGKNFSGGMGAWLTNLMRHAGIQRNACSVVSAIPCQPLGEIPPGAKGWRYTPGDVARAAVQSCAAQNLLPFIEQQRPQRVITFGDAPLALLTPRQGVTVWRGSPLPLRTDLTQLRVLPTIHPRELAKNAELISVAPSDMRKQLQAPPEHYELFAFHDRLAAFDATVFAFDFEWDVAENITICGLSDRLYTAVTGTWGNGNVAEFRRIFERATDLIGHNIIGADTRYFERLGWTIPGSNLDVHPTYVRLHDTMLKQHLVQPDMRHGLGFVASVFTNKPFWKDAGGEDEEDEAGNIVVTKAQWRTWNQVDAIPRALGGYGGCSSDDEAYRLYNARDTDASFQINHALDALLERYGLTQTYWCVSVPAALICRELNEAGIKIAPERVTEIRTDLMQKVQQLEQTLPEGLRPYEKPVNRNEPAPEGTYKAKTLKCKGTKKAGTSHEQCAWTIDQPGEHRCPVCQTPKAAKLAIVKIVKVPGTETVTPWNSPAQVKQYAKRQGLPAFVDRKTKREKADVNARKRWGRTNPEFRILDKLTDYSTLCESFAKASLQSIDRMFFQLMVHGTNEGRLACKGQRRGIDLQIQNVPAEIKGIFMPDQPDWCFIELDYASGENFLTAHLAQDHERMHRLRQPGYSEHLELAKRLFKLPAATTKSGAQAWHGQDLYDIGKHINHGSNYGMSHIKLKEYCDGQGYFFNEKECKGFIEAGKELNPRTAAWQRETQALAKRDGFLSNPFRRRRWFGHRVNTECLAFLPASTLADITLRAMVAHRPERFATELAALGIAVQGAFAPGWRLSMQIHDSLVLQGPAEHWQQQTARTAAIMQQSWAALNGFALSVEAKVGAAGASWGDIKKVNLDQLGGAA